MALESVTYISDLNSSNPTATDQVSQGDDHLRAIKTGILGTFSGFTGAALVATEAELDVLAAVTAGTVAASKGVVVDSNSKVDVWNVDNVTINGNDISSTNTNGNITMTPNGTGVVQLVSTTLDMNGGWIQIDDADGIQDANGNELVRFQTTTSAITFLDITNGATTVNPIISAQGEADTGIDFENDQAEKLMVMECVATPVNWLQLSNAATTNRVQFLNPGEDDVGFTFDAKNSEPMLTLSATAAATTYIDILSNSTTANPVISVQGEADIGITFSNDQSEEMLILNAVATAVNELTIHNAATGNRPIIAATGEADNGIEFHNDQSEEILILASAATSVNEVTITSAAATVAPSIAATGDDTNINLTVTGKGTGGILFPFATQTNTQVDSPVTVTAGQSGTIFDNTGASGSIIYNLPAVSGNDGVWYGFMLVAAQLMSPTSSTTETIRHGANTGTAKIESATAAGGDCLVMYCDGTQWNVINAFPTEADWTVSS